MTKAATAFRKQPNPRYVAHGFTPGGQPEPFTLKPAAYPLITKLAREGHGVTTIAARLGMSKDTFRELRKRDVAAQAALDEGHSGLEDETTAVIVQEMRKGNLLAAFALGKMRFGWREGTPAEATAPTSTVNVQINMPASMSDEQFKQLCEAPLVQVQRKPGDDDGPGY